MKNKRCFVIGPMNNEHIKYLHWLARDVVGEILSNRGFKVFTPDVKELGNIMNHVIRSADRADLVVADTTGNNPNVLYEIAVLDSMGRACVPVKLYDENEKGQENDKVPFDRAAYRYFRVPKGNTEEAIKELMPVIFDVLEKQENGDMQSNPVTDFFGITLSSLSSANGLARGYYRNFVIPAVQGEIIEGPIYTLDTKKLELETIIPDTLEHATRGMIEELKEAHIIVPITLSADGRKIAGYIWNQNISKEPILVDIPTALGQLRDNVIARLGKLVNIDPVSQEFKEIEQDEINQFVRYLNRFKVREPDTLGTKVRRKFKIVHIEECRYPALFKEIV